MTVGKGELRNRIKELRYVDASEIEGNPKNWRAHPQAQSDALAGVLREIGIADALIAYEHDGRLRLIDGHLRKDSAGGTWPVLVLDVDEAEADLLLATLDPLTSMATAAKEALDALLSSVGTGEAAVQAMLAESAAAAGLYLEGTPSLDELEDQYGEPGERDFWPIIKVQVSPATKAKYDELMKQLPGQDEAAKFDALVSSSGWGETREPA